MSSQVGEQPIDCAREDAKVKSSQVCAPLFIQYVHSIDSFIYFLDREYTPSGSATEALEVLVRVHVESDQ